MARLAILAVALSSASDAAEDAKAIDGIIGGDDRRIVESLDPPWNAVGKINVAGYRKTRHCTATLITPRVVVTAAHCLLKPGSGNVEPLRNIHFLAGARRGKFLAHARAKCVTFMKDFRAEPGGPLVRAARDAAMIVTTEDLDLPSLPRVSAAAPVAGERLVHASYARDRPHVLAADATCRFRAAKGGLWLTDCDTNFGGSGGPVFVRALGELKLAAIMIGYVKGQYSIAVPAATWIDMAKTARCK